MVNEIGIAIFPRLLNVGKRVAPNGPKVVPNTNKSVSSLSSLRPVRPRKNNYNSKVILDARNIN